MKSIEITGVPLIKFKDDTVIKSIQAGHIWLNPVSTYRKVENETGDKAVGDKFEAMWPLRDAYVYVPDKEFVQHVENGYIKTTHMDDYVFCILKMVGTKDEFFFTDEQKEKLTEFGDVALMIYDSTEFVRRIEKAAEAQGYKLVHREVNYYDSSEDNGKLICDLMHGMENIVFWKRDDYKYQQEIRFAVQRETLKEEHLVLEIGDISDISVKMTTKDMLGMYLKKA